jgi:hypothetical protein
VVIDKAVTVPSCNGYTKSFLFSKRSASYMSATILAASKPSRLFFLQNFIFLTRGFVANTSAPSRTTPQGSPSSGPLCILQQAGGQGPKRP